MSNPQKVFYEYLRALIIALLAAIVIRIFIVQAFRIPTGSMKDTLLIGDFILVNKFEYGVQFPDTIPLFNLPLPSIRFPSFRQPQRGDIIVFKYPKDKSVDYIKRCIGLPGDTLMIRDNKVFINGGPEGIERLIEETYDVQERQSFVVYQIQNDFKKTYTIRKQADGRSRLDSYGPVVIPPDYYFMMGDNRDNSYDSRYWGFLPRKYIIGRASMIYFSINPATSKPYWQFFSAVRWSRLLKRVR